MVLPPLVLSVSPSPGKRLITSPRIVLLPAVNVRPPAEPPAPVPFNSTRMIASLPSGLLFIRLPGCVKPSRKTGSVIVGSAEVRLIVCRVLPGMLKLIVSRPANAFASRMAWRRDPARLSLALMTVKVPAFAKPAVRRSAARVRRFGQRPLTTVFMPGLLSGVVLFVNQIRLPPGLTFFSSAMQRDCERMRHHSRNDVVVIHS